MVDDITLQTLNTCITICYWGGHPEGKIKISTISYKCAKLRECTK